MPAYLEGAFADGDAGEIADALGSRRGPTLAACLNSPRTPA